jgi:hypothetical protein
MSVDPASAVPPWLLGSIEPAEHDDEEAALPNPDTAGLRGELAELADALTRARAEVAAVDPPGAATGRPSILAATAELEALVWSMREQGIEPQLCDRIAGCAGNIRAACAVPDLTAERTRAIADLLGHLEIRLHAIRTALDGGVYAQESFGDLDGLPAANANSPTAPRPPVIEASLDAEVAAFAPAPATETEPMVVDVVAEDAVGTEIGPAAAPAFAGEISPIEMAPTELSPTEIAPTEMSLTETSSIEISPAVELERYFDGQPAAAPAATPASPRLTPRLMEAELDRLLDAQAAAAPSDHNAP